MKKYFLLILSAMLLLLISCNSEGMGIFYQISEEVKQIDSNISELAVYQVVEVGTAVYARTGRSAWVQTASNWTNIGDGNYIYNIGEYDDAGTPTLYGVINNDDNNLSEGKVMSYDGSNWNLVYAYNTKLSLFEADDNYILISGTDISTSISGVDSTDFIPSTIADEVIRDGAASGADHFLISSDAIYGSLFGVALSAQTEPTGVDGDYCGLATDGADIYLTTSGGQVFKWDGAAWSLSGTISDDEPVRGSLEVVTLGGTTDYLIIGTDNGYYEMNITASGSIVEPTATTSVENFSATYPDLTTELIFEVYQSAAGVTGEYFYLATSGGLWKRLANGTFVRQ